MLICSLATSACSTAKINSTSTVQIPNDAWWNQLVNLKQIQPANENIPQVMGPFDSLKDLAIVRSKMKAVSPINFVIGFSGDGDINVFASMQNGKNLVIFTNGFMRQFGGDADVLATVLGHELGHHQLGHTQPNYAKNRNSTINAVSQALGMISSYFIPFSGLLVDNAVKGVALSYSRDDERDADVFGMKLAVAAGYSACGSYRFALKMNELSQGPVLTFLSTHPGNDERIERAQELNAFEKLGPCQK